MQITAAVVPATSAPFEMRELELEAPGPGEVLVRMVATGVCHTDQVIRDQMVPVPLPAVLGHEGAGVVEGVGAGVSHVHPGDHVVLSYNSCGLCPNCMSGAPGYCSEFGAYNFGGRRADGTSALRSGDEQVSSHFFGQSSFATHAVVAACATIIAVDRVPERVAFAQELGATHGVDVAKGDPVEQIMDITHGAGVDYALETTGVPPVLRQTVDALAVRGTAGLIGQAKIGAEVAFETGASLIRGWTLTTIVEGDAVPQVFIPRLIELYRAGRFPFDKLIRHYPFAEIETAFTDSEQGRTVKPVLTF
jgi:aryl-alcohol dehydrogenase